MLNRRLFSIINRNYTTKIKKYDLHDFFYDPREIYTDMYEIINNRLYKYKFKNYFSAILNLKSDFNTYNKYLDSYKLVINNFIIDKTYQETLKYCEFIRYYENITYLSYIATQPDVFEKYLLSIKDHITMNTSNTIYIFNIGINYNKPLYFKILKIIAKFNLINLTTKEQLMLDNINASNIIMG